MSAHAKLSPSGAERWMACPGSVALEDGLPDSDSEYSREGTAAHEMAQLTLESGAMDCDKFVGRMAENGVTMTQDMADNVIIYVNNVRDYAKGHELMVEQRLSIEHLTEEPDAKGTSDAVILTHDELQVHDLKYGKGVRKHAELNEQLMIYALAALREFEMLGDFKRVRLVIHQPRLDHLSEWDCTVEELMLFAEQVSSRAEKCRSAVTFYKTHGELHEKYLVPGETQCRFCKAKATCPSIRDFVLKTVTDEFVDLDQPIAPIIEERLTAIYDNTILGKLLGTIDLIESWCKSIRSKAETEMLAGRAVPGYKLVQGRMGARAWTDPTVVEETMKSMRLKVDQMYDFKLISPTSAEKVLKDKPKCWKRLSELIGQKQGGPSVAPESDKRPALVIQTEEFEALPDPEVQEMETELEGMV